MPDTVNPRRLRLDKQPLPGLQWRLVGSFVALTAIALLLQYTLITSTLSRVATAMPVGGEFLARSLPGALGKTFLLSMLGLIPLSALVGLLISFRWAGPLHRFHVYLRQVVRGEARGPCRIRRKDELQELCGLINQALDVSRRSEPRQDADEPATVEPGRAA